MSAQAALPLNEPAMAPRIVPYDLPEHTAWNGLFLVGEAPGAEEAKQGHPFVGRSGQLLNDALGKAGIDRGKTVVANVFRTQPPGNKVDHFFISKRASVQQNIDIDSSLGQFGSAWVRQDFAADIHLLASTIKKWQPRMVVALGRTPFWALTGQNGLLSAVGQPFECRLDPKTTIMPTFHPSFILRGNWGLQPQWIEHFVTAREKAGS